MLQTEIDLAAQLARQAGALVLEVYASRFDVELKGKSDPVTEADRRANAFLVAGLRERFPTDGIVAEESLDHTDSMRAGRCWFVDPLDGTKEFIARNGEFSVMIGLAIDGRAVLGVVYQPDGDKLYRGVVGQGASLEHGGATRALQVSELAAPSALRLVVSRSHRSKDTDAVVQRLGISAERPSGSVGLKVGLITEQSADLYVHMSGHASLWDACGPDAILHAAGGRFTDLYGEPIDYRSTQMKVARGLLACNAASFAAVAPVVREVATAAGIGAA
ncbi:MAG TPA: 3'(2'),5'-bisphosphate nucleotidase CysQ [Polyangiales bacterium]|nr:3'(2'),5'-bisphosphate nucleotidase CysQ [Polyangiales bacterium]